MHLQSRLLASGPGWAAYDFICTAGPRDRPVEEMHDGMCIAAVVDGTFQYRSARGGAVLAPGAMLLGNHGSCFRCGHEHGTGDRCLSFHFEPDFFEAIVAALPRVRRADFAISALPPLAEFTHLLAAAEAARDGGDEAALEDLALRLAAAVAASLADERRPARQSSRRDEARISEAVRRIEANSDDRITLSALARESGMSPYHFLRTFRDVVGMTPHQFMLRLRMHRAAVRIRTSGEPISAIAFDAGFNDLSTFNRRFRRLMGATPSAFRAGHGEAGI
jgi:AraC-like DNA-binding protein